MPEQHRSTVTRRAALSRLLALGAGATAALALPGAAQAAPVVPAAPALPDWLAPVLERIARAAVTFPEATASGGYS
jgi:hypothetical protein